MVNFPFPAKTWYGENLAGFVHVDIDEDCLTLRQHEKCTHKQSLKGLRSV